MSLSSALGVLSDDRRAPVDIVLDLVVAAYRESASLLRLVQPQNINAYGALPSPEANIYCPAMMVAPLSVADVVAPGEILSAVYIQTVLRYQITSNEPKAPGQASAATQLWEAARVLLGLGLLSIANGSLAAKLAQEGKPVPVNYPPMRSAAGWLQDLAVGWKFIIPLDSETLKPRALAAIGL